MKYFLRYTDGRWEEISRASYQSIRFTMAHGPMPQDFEGCAVAVLHGVESAFSSSLSLRAEGSNPQSAIA
jgi:hypothetical protein